MTWIEEEKFLISWASLLRNEHNLCFCYSSIAKSYEFMYEVSQAIHMQSLWLCETVKLSNSSGENRTHTVGQSQHGENGNESVLHD